MRVLLHMVLSIFCLLFVTFDLATQLVVDVLPRLMICDSFVYPSNEDWWILNDRNLSGVNPFTYDVN